MLGVNATTQCTSADSQYHSKDLSTNISRHRASVGFGLKKENDGHQALARN